LNLEYIDENGEVKRPALIHRAPLGSLERFVGLLIEHYAGKFPVWLAPVQIELIPISDRHQEYAKLVKQALLKREIRVELDNRSETMQAKIRDATLQKIPFTAIIGDKEVEAAKGKEESDWVVSVRNLDGQNIGPKTLKELLELLV
jgi:threonyl-tRNA synthetase